MLEALLGRPELSNKSVFCPSLTFSLTSISKLSSEVVSAEYLLHLEKPPILTVSWRKEPKILRGVFGLLYTTWIQRLHLNPPPYPQVY